VAAAGPGYFLAILERSFYDFAMAANCPEKKNILGGAVAVLRRPRPEVFS